MIFLLIGVAVLATYLFIKEENSIQETKSFSFPEEEKKSQLDIFEEMMEGLLEKEEKND